MPLQLKASLNGGFELTALTHETLRKHRRDMFKIAGPGQEAFWRTTKP